MSRALLAFNPEAHRSGGDTLLFGVAVPAAPRTFGLSALEELNLASQFLEARSGTVMAALLKYIIHRSSAAQGRALDPRLVGLLLHHLTRAATTVRDAMQSDAAAVGFPRSPEAIFGTELEGLSPEDREFETARHFVWFANDLARTAARAAPNAVPGIVASHAERLTARRLAPGLSRALGQPPMDFHARRRARPEQ